MHPLYFEIRKALTGFYPDAEAAALAKMLLVEGLGFSNLELFGGKDKEVFTNDLDVLHEMLGRLQNYEPIQYIIGRETFCGMTFGVDGNVLIPRPETQDLVQWIADDCMAKNPCRIIDMGTGSGCIAISLAKRLTHAQIGAWDISDGALEVARQNAHRNAVEVCFCKQDILSAIPTKECVEVIVSNPPYIVESEKVEMESNVLHWEPHLALFVPDNNPLLFYRAIACLGKDMLVRGGILYFEINRAYGKETMAMLQELGYQSAVVRKDRFGNERMVKAVKP